MPYKETCDDMVSKGWLSHVLAASNIEYGGGTKLSTGLRRTKTYQDYASGRFAPRFDRSAAVSAKLNYRDAEGPHADEVLVSRTQGLIMKLDQGKECVGYLSDIPRDRLDEGTPSPSGANERRRLHVGSFYTRSDLYEVLAVPPEQRRGDWDTGHHRHEDEWFIFATVGGPGRTGHDYANHWEGDRFIWRSKNGTQLHNASIRHLTRAGGTVHLLTRDDDREPFLYRGLVEAVGTEDTVPATVIWKLVGVTVDSEPPDEVPSGIKVPEGALKTITVNAYERKPELRRRCIAHWGTCCAACGMSFGTAYGPHGEGFIHVHHLKPLCEVNGEHDVDPITDLRPVCPNCHAMLHRSGLLSIEELQTMIQKATSTQ